MKKFKVTVERSGYARGLQVYLVDAETAEEAKDRYYVGENLGFEMVRDDMEIGDITVEEIT